MMTAMRSINLATLRLDQHIVQPGGTRGEMFIVLPAGEVKNSQPMEYPIPAESAALIRSYMRDYRPRLCGAESPWLFPGRGGQCGQRGRLGPW